MKKLVTLTLLAAMSTSTLVMAEGVTAVATPNLLISSNENNLVPAREFGEGAGYNVKWDGKLRSITFEKEDGTYTAYLDSNVYDVKGEEVTLEDETVLKEDMAYIPNSFKDILVEPKSTPLIPLESIPTEELATLPLAPLVPSEPAEATTAPVEKIEDAIMDVDAAEKICETVNLKMEELTKEQVKANEEYKTAYLETGGTIEEYKEPSYEVGYEILEQNEDYISVKVYRYQALASSFTEEIYYNFNSKTSEIIKLEDVLGSKYAEYVKESVLMMAANREEKDSEKYNYDETLLEDLVIDENTSFYLNKDGNVVVVFDKYEIAAGAYGAQEFIIPSVTK
ncbi:MAG: stalk domain-containing protein [Lachnospirales bacterium]